MAFCCHGLPPDAADRIRIAAQKTGTLAWELAVIKAHGLDAKAGLDLVVTELAAPEAGKIALKGGAADVIVTDFLWVARERALGGRLVFQPYGGTLGAVMVPAASTRNAFEGSRRRARSASPAGRSTRAG